MNIVFYFFIYIKIIKLKKLTKSNCFNIDIPLILDGNWTIIKFDPINFINNNLSKELLSLGNLTNENTVLKSLCFWSTITIRGVYVSNNIYSLNNLPKEMTNKINDTQQYVLNFMDMVVLKPGEELENEEKDIDSKIKSTKRDFSAEDIIDMNSLNEIERKNKEIKEESRQRSKDNLRVTKRTNESTSKKKNYEKVDYDFKEVQNEILKKNVIK